MLATDQAARRAPLVFMPLLKERVWGGDTLKSRAPDPPPGPVGESWEIVDLGTDVSRTAEGVSLRDLLTSDGEALLGPARDPLCGDRFPLLLKLLDARHDLSVQVHPDDAGMRALGLPGPGKSEAWFVLDAEPGARIVRGLGPGATLGELARALRRGDRAEIDSLLNFVPVRSGDLVRLPAGTIHALGAGIRVLEVQRSADVTFRLYDWGRPRPVQLEHALAAAAADDDAGAAGADEPDEPAGADDVPDASLGFSIEVLRERELDTGGRGFHVLTFARGAGRIITAGGAVARGALDSALVASSAGAYRIETEPGAVVLLSRFLPPAL